MPSVISEFMSALRWSSANQPARCMGQPVKTNTGEMSVRANHGLVMKVGSQEGCRNSRVITAKRTGTVSRAPTMTRRARSAISPFRSAASMSWESGWTCANPSRTIGAVTANDCGADAVIFFEVESIGVVTPTTSIEPRIMLSAQENG